MRTPASEVRPFDQMIGDVFERVRCMSRIDYEVSLLRLLERVTNGTVIEISLTGASPKNSDPALQLNCSSVEALQSCSNPGS